ncbi:helix-turn-helix domain-containing protein [Actinomadura rudentiformis]|uniref:Helix-turn-helix transcriptional regulator n=1 Tax=Actinomadura rudentiformis TaxID=359158 RepID=A0A6H9Z0U3_9ACTN|nr:helix-turn-helix transcriptional regulator [Actinomadura rudentiformis]KAB2350275.1 helix-turn-helix transcriptional regulator [Actinomadura rudentiformis]
MPGTSPVDPNSSLYAWLAHDLRFYREKHRLSQAQLGKIIGRSYSSLSNCEANRRKITQKEAKILDELWDTGGHFQRLLMFARLSHDPDWFRQHVEYEAKAIMLKIFELSFIPGLLQTPEYARANLAEGGHKDVEAAVDARMARQAILTRTDPPLLWIVMDEAVLHRMVGGAATMRGQLGRLLEVGELPNVTIRLVPWSAGAYAGQDGAFKVLSLESEDVAYVEAPGGGRLVQDGPEIRSFGVRYDRIGMKALPDDLSRGRIVDAMESMK